MIRILCLFCLAIVASFGCGRTDTPPPPNDNDLPAETLRWVQPPLFADCTALDLRRDILCYEIHANDNCAWRDNTAVAIVGGVGTTGDPRQSFDLMLLAPFGIQPGDNGTYLTVRSVGIDNAASEFGEPTFWWRERP